MLKNLKILRKERKISQLKLAVAMGISQQSINKYENHDVQPDIETLKRFADYFYTSIDYLVGYTDIRGKIRSPEAFYVGADEIRIIEEYRNMNTLQRDCLNLLLKAFSE